MVNHPDEAWTLFSGTAPDLRDELNAQAWKDTVPRFSQSPAALDHGRYARFEAFLHDAGLVPEVLPVDRLAVRTYVLPFDGVALREALLREKYRGGQAYFVAPRIADLPDSSLRARRLRGVTAYCIAAPSYLASRGTPRLVADLAHHDHVRVLPPSLAPQPLS